METEKSNVLNSGFGFGLGDILSLLLTSSLFGVNSFSSESSERYYESMYGKHFNEKYAKIKVGILHYKESNGEDKRGEHWSVERIKELTSDKQFHDSVTDWDKYVAYNYMYSILCNTLSYEQILEVTYKMWFENQFEFGKAWEFLGNRIFSI